MMDLLKLSSVREITQNVASAQHRFCVYHKNEGVDLILRKIRDKELRDVA
jgi:hypothetical protein